MPSEPKSSIANPLSVLPEAVSVRPTAVLPAQLPFSTIRGAVPVPDWVVPSITTGWERRAGPTEG